MIDLQYRDYSKWQIDRFTERYGSPVRFRFVVSSFDGGSETLFGLAAADVDLDAEATAYVERRYCGDLPTVEVIR